MIVALLFYSDEPAFVAMSQEERNALVERHIAFNKEVVQPRSLLMVNRALQPTVTGRTVWPQGDARAQEAGQGHAGPLALSGFYLIDCRDLDEAEEIARAYPMPVGLGCVEVRPALEDWDYGPSVDLEAIPAERVWEHHADLAGWPRWAPWVCQVAVPSDGAREGSRGEVTLSGGWQAQYVLRRVVAPTLLAVELTVEGADAALTVELMTEPLPRGAVRVRHRATVPRGLLDRTGTSFSAELNAQLREGLRVLATRLSGWADHSRRPWSDDT